MGRTCAACNYYCSCREFSRNQWDKGEGYSRCRDCVDGGQWEAPPSYQCGQCGKCFDNQNNLNMHMQVHRSRNVACPICGEQRFRSGANAVQHVESGYCSGCRGQANARDQIYRFASSKRSMQRYMNAVPMLTNGRNTSGVPDFPYQCPVCSRSFRQLSQLMQHQDQKHGNQHMMIGY